MKILKTIIIIFLLVFAAAKLMAQTGLHQGFTLGVLYTSLPNADDKKAGPELDYAPTFRLSAGFEMGYGLGNEGRADIAFQITYAGAGQRYKGASDTDPLFKRDGRTYLHYLKVPLLFRYYFGSNTWRPYIGAGFYAAYLLAYKDKVVNQGSNGIAGETVTQTVSFTKTKYEQTGWGPSPISFDLQEPIYNALDFGPVVLAGVEKAINKRISVSACFRMDYGLTDVENKGMQPQSQTSPGFDPWGTISSKYSYQAQKNNRGKTNNVSIGFLLTLSFYLSHQR